MYCCIQQTSKQQWHLGYMHFLNTEKRWKSWLCENSEEESCLIRKSRKGGEKDIPVASKTNRKGFLYVEPRIASKFFINQLIRLRYTSLDSKNTKKKEDGKKNGVVVLDQQKWWDWIGTGKKKILKKCGAILDWSFSKTRGRVWAWLS